MQVQEIWKCIHPQVSYSPWAFPSGNMILLGKYIFIFPSPECNKCIICSRVLTVGRMTVLLITNVVGNVWYNNCIVDTVLTETVIVFFRLKKPYGAVYYNHECSTPPSTTFKLIMVFCFIGFLRNPRHFVSHWKNINNCEIIIIRGVLIFVDFLVHKNHKN